MKKPLLVLALVVALGILGWWRWSARPLSDEAVLRSHLSSLEAAANTKNSREILRLLAPEFQGVGLSRDEVRAHLAGLFFTHHKVVFSMRDAQVSVNGESATTAGSFEARLHADPNDPGQIHAGEFELWWVKREGSWSIVGGNATTRTAN